jgi:hypothetical protein
MAPCSTGHLPEGGTPGRDPDRAAPRGRGRSADDPPPSTLVHETLHTTGVSALVVSGAGGWPCCSPRARGLLTEAGADTGAEERSRTAARGAEAERCGGGPGVVASTSRPSTTERTPTPSHDRHHHQPRTGRHAVGLSRDKVWMRYFALGGVAGFQVEAYLIGALVPTPHDYDVLAVALNERFSELGGDHPTPLLRGRGRRTRMRDRVPTSRSDRLRSSLTAPRATEPSIPTQLRGPLGGVDHERRHHS